MTLVQDIDALLPQTQCGLCGYAGCRPYAEAMAIGAATIQHCPPGGVKTLYALGSLLGIDPKPYEVEVLQQQKPSALAEIREAECIGCTKCIQACPVDAIVGAAKFMHTVLSQECTGCGLCVDPCPVDCIDMIEGMIPQYHPDLARARYQAKQIRSLAEENVKLQHYRNQRRLSEEKNNETAEKAAKKAYILEALARVKAK